MSDRFYRMPAAGGGYELALAMDYLILIDDGNAAVSLPEIPLLAVLPGAGGLTRIVDKRKGRREEWLPDNDDLEFLLSLMEQVTEPGKFAHWIAPPGPASTACPAISNTSGLLLDCQTTSLTSPLDMDRRFTLFFAF